MTRLLHQRKKKLCKSSAFKAPVQYSKKVGGTQKEGESGGYDGEENHQGSDAPKKGKGPW